jgi:hypothetical protein
VSIRSTPGLHGLEFVDLELDSEGRWVLRLHFIPDESAEPPQPVPPGLTLRNIQLTEGPRDVPSLLRPERLMPGLVPEVVRVVLSSRVAWAEAESGTVLRISLVNLPTLDVHFSGSRFGLDPAGRSSTEDESQVVAPTEIYGSHTYLAKDYASLLKLMQGRLELTQPGWRETSPADLGTVLIEGFAYLADHLSYHQDAVGTEAYLDTARHRISVRRHARLMGCRASEGCGSRAWLFFEAEDDVGHVAAGVELQTPSPNDDASGSTHETFRTMEAMEIYGAHNEMPVHTWGLASWTLARGATKTALLGHYPRLRAGDVLVLEMLRRSADGQVEVGDRTLRHLVRLDRAPVLTEDGPNGSPITEIGWFAADALPFDLVVDALGDGHYSTTARGNLALGAQGRRATPLVDAIRWQGSRLHVAMAGHALLHFEPWYAQRQKVLPARESLWQSPSAAVPAMQVIEQRPDGHDRVWTACTDLMHSGPFDRHFAVEVDDEGDLLVRFGDGQLGRRAPDARRCQVVVWTGVGPAGNVAADTIQELTVPIPGVRAVRNPTPAAGGQVPERTEQLRARAISGVRELRRCITTEDYVTKAREHPLVRDAAATRSWNGSWQVMMVTVLPRESDTLSEQLRVELTDYLSQFRMIGVDIDIGGPGLVHPELELKVFVDASLPMMAVRASIHEALAGQSRRSRKRSFLHPDRWSLGQHLYEGPVVACLAEISGVRWVEVVRFQRRDATEYDVEPGRITIASDEVLRLPHGAGDGLGDGVHLTLVGVE